jgi:hypothetical protein
MAGLGAVDCHHISFDEPTAGHRRCAKVEPALDADYCVNAINEHPV